MKRYALLIAACVAVPASFAMADEDPIITTESSATPTTKPSVRIERRIRVDASAAPRGMADSPIRVRVFKDGEHADKIRAEVDAARAAYGSAGMQDVKLEKATFLGVAVTDTSFDLAEHLGLPKGVGLTVQEVVDDSPAKKAGLQPHDVLQSIEGQLLINPDQLATYVRTLKADQEVTIKLIRKGTAMELKAKLAEKDLPALAEGPMGVTNGVWTASAPPDVMMLRDLAEVAPPAPGEPPRIIHLARGTVSSKIASNDSDGSVDIRIVGDDVKLVVTDKDGKVLFDGPYNTDEEKAKLPEAHRERVDKMLKRHRDAEFDVPAAPPAPAAPAAPAAPTATPSTQPAAMIDPLPTMDVTL
jgi:hypothetical protein